MRYQRLAGEFPKHRNRELNPMIRERFRRNRDGILHNREGCDSRGWSEDPLLFAPVERDPGAQDVSDRQILGLSSVEDCSLKPR